MNFIFSSDSVPLDLVATVRYRWEDQPLEMLDSAASLAEWLQGSGVLDAPNATPDDLEPTIALRETLYRVVAATLAGGAAEDADLDALNTAAAAPPVVPALTADGVTRSGTVANALSSIAREAIELLAGPEAALVKQCANPGCRRLFLDRSRGARREWCSMDPCGNRIKAAAYRARKRTAASGERVATEKP